MVQEVLKNKPAPQFKRVVMSLADIVEVGFLGKYIKSGKGLTFPIYIYIYIFLIGLIEPKLTDDQGASRCCQKGEWGSTMSSL